MPTFPAHVFREYDIRGLVASDLTPEFTRALGRGFAAYLKERTAGQGRQVALGRDCRTSSVTLRDAMVDGITSSGLDVLDIGTVPTPLTYFAANTLPVDGLVMITGSHNPPEYNGFKIGVGKTTLAGPEIQEVRRVIDGAKFVSGRGGVTPFDIVTPYLHFVKQTLRLGPRKLKVVVDAGNGMGGMVAVPLFQALGFDVTALFIEPDGTFPNHHPDPTVEKNMQDLIRAVREKKADVGIAYDGDADRIGAVDEQGSIMWGDQLLTLFARHILADAPGAAVVGEVKCSATLYQDIARHGGRPIMWKTGHSLIKAKMKEEGALIAGEMSGHIFFRHRYFGFDDAIYSSGRLLEILTRSDKPLSQQLADLPKTYASPEIRSDFPEDKKFRAVEAAQRWFRERGYKTIEVDGVRVELDDGWGLIRASNTQPLLVLRFEATTESRLAEIQSLIEKALAEVRTEVGY
jgi:phosphomannomutase/phosphoglucomutase